MPIPVATRMIHADIRNPDGTPASGSIEFIQGYWLYDETGNVVLAPGSYTGAIDAGEATVEVPATDAAGVTPTGRTVTVRIIAAAQRAYYDIEVPSGDGTLELADLAPVANVGTPTTYATAAALTALDAEVASHTAGTTAVHGIADTAALVLEGDARLTDARTPTAHAAAHGTAGADPLTPTAIGAYPATGGTINGDLTVTEHNITVRKTDGTNALRIRSTGDAIDYDTVGDVTVISWGGADFTGSETLRQRWHAGGVTIAGRLAVASTVYGNDQYLDGGVAVLGGKNAGATVTIAGRTAAPGAPSAGTWAAGDAVLDPDGVWHLCSTGGTPGVWISAAGVYAWADLSLQAGTTAWNTAPASRLEPLYRVVRCKGQVLNATGGTITAGTTLAVVDAEHRPPGNLSIRLTRAAAVDDQRMFTINAATGALTSASGLGPGEAVVLDGLTWAL